MPSILWVNDNGTMSVVEVDDEGNRIDLPVEPAPKPAEAPAKPKFRRNKRG